MVKIKLKNYFSFFTVWRWMKDCTLETVIFQNF